MDGLSPQPQRRNDSGKHIKYQHLWGFPRKGALKSLWIIWKWPYLCLQARETRTSGEWIKFASSGSKSIAEHPCALFCICSCVDSCLLLLFVFSLWLLRTDNPKSAGASSSGLRPYAVTKHKTVLLPARSLPQLSAPLCSWKCHGKLQNDKEGITVSPSPMV